MSIKPVIYIASPYTKGDPCINTNFQLRTFDELMNDGVVIPFAPLWSHYQHTSFPRPYRDWIEYDLALIPRFDGCLRLDSTHPLFPSYLITESSGADNEVAAFRSLNKPVFFSKHELYRWASKR